MREAAAPLIIVFALGLGGGLASCLFPSFDELRAGRGRPLSPDDDSVERDADTASANDASPIGDGRRTIECTDACAPPRFCCTTIGGPTCQDRGTEVFCTSVEGGRIFRCDGPDDCEPGEACCFDGSEARCATDCGSGQALCNGARICPSGKSCSALIESIYRACN